jgi:hypothetical protein
LRKSFEEVEINAVGATPQRVVMKFHVAKVQRPLASAVKIAEAGNRFVMSKGAAYIEHEETGTRMPLRVERSRFASDVEFECGSEGTITRQRRRRERLAGEPPAGGASVSA